MLKKVQVFSRFEQMRYENKQVNERFIAISFDLKVFK